jgi:hypothetical protein
MCGCVHLAIRTESRKVENMILDDEPGGALELLDEGLEVLGARELDQLLTAPANEVVSVMVLGQCVAVAAVLRVDTAGDPQFDEQLQRAVDRDQPERWCLLPGTLVDRFGAQPTVAVGKRFDHSPAGCGEPEAAPAQLGEHRQVRGAPILIENIFH